MAFERAFSTEERVGFATLRNTKGSGEPIGSYRDRPIYGIVTDEYGRRFHYLGLAPRLPSGKFDPDALATGEFILLPGLLYVAEEPIRRGIGARLRALAPSLHRDQERESY